MTSIKSFGIILHVALAGLDDMWGVTEIALLAYGVCVVALGDFNHSEVFRVFLMSLGRMGGRSVLLVIVLFSVDDNLVSPFFSGSNILMKHHLPGNRS